MTGRSIAHYELLEKLGEGGMGVVHKARDTHLDRFVAIKILPAAKVADPERKRRFVQEAKAASALNHPNIVTIHDIGQDDGLDYIAMEFVPGQTLDQLIGRKGMKLRDALHYAIQMADALARAHAAGIVHRDLKPANIMVTPDGLVKVLDFGLAKLTEPAPSEDKLTATIGMTEKPRTEEGTIVGTAAYMSPEQAEGRPVDARSDIFSFGSVLYEMLTGQRAFRGDTKVSILAAILHSEPHRASEIAPAVPAEVERVLGRCLRKDPQRRWQNMSDLKVALIDLKEESESGSLVAGAAAASKRSAHRLLIPAVAALLVLLAGTAWWLSRARTGTSEWNAEPLTFDKGLTFAPAISDDGKLVAYSSDRAEDGNYDIWVQQVTGGQPLRLTTHSAFDTTPSFSPDGSRIVYSSSREGGGIYTVNTLGGGERRIAGEGVFPRFSPDGSMIVYVLPVPSGRLALNRMFLVSAEGGPPRPFQPGFGAVGQSYPVQWSADGKHLLFAGVKAKDPRTYDWWVAPLDGGEPVPTGALKKLPRPPVLGPAAWAGGFVCFLSGTNTEGVNLFRVPMGRNWQIGGSPQRLTSGAGMRYSASISRDGRIVFPNLTWQANIQSIAIDPKTGAAAGVPHALTADTMGKFELAVARDGSRLAYTAFSGVKTGRRTELRLRDLASGTESVLAALPPAVVTIAPRLNRDGSMLAYTQPVAGKYAVMLVTTASGSVRQVCDACAIFGTLPGAGQIAVLRGAGPRSVVRLDAANGAETPLLADADGRVIDGEVSPDGAWVLLLIEKSDGSYGLRAAPVKPSPVPVSEWVPLLDPPVWIGAPRWSAAADGVYFLAELDGYSCIWYLRLEPASKKPAAAPTVFLHAHSSRMGHAATRNVRGLSVATDRVFVNFAETTGNLWIGKLDR